MVIIAIIAAQVYDNSLPPLDENWGPIKGIEWLRLLPSFVLMALIGVLVLFIPMLSTILLTAVVIKLVAMVARR